MKCDSCLNSRPVISENGFHHVCCLSSKAAQNCLSGKKIKYESVADVIAKITKRGGDT